MFGAGFGNMAGGGYGSPSTKGSMGGGFLGSTGSPSVGGQENQSRIHSIFPATIAQLHKIQETEGKMMHHDREISQIRVIGMIHDVRPESSRHTYTLQDMTGDIEVQQFLDSDNNVELAQMECMRDGNWVAVLGTLKNFQGKRSITAFRVIPILDANEVTSHILECIDANMYLRKLQRDKLSGGTAGDMQVDSVAGAGFGANITNSYGNSGLSSLQQQLIMSISACHDERGMSIHDMISTLSKQYKEVDIRQAVDFLVQEGHIYSSVDDEHFLSTG